MACNGTKSIKLNKTVEVKSQKYIHRKCEKSSCITSLIKFKDKFCTYMRSICEKGIIRTLIGYSSYQNKKELKKITYDIERIQNIFTAQTHKQAQRRFKTIYNQRTELNNHIQHFLEKIEPEPEIILNHTIYEEIPATNNTVENYYRTTLLRCQKRIYKTLTGLKKVIKIAQIRWTHRNVLKETDNIDLNTYK